MKENNKLFTFRIIIEPEKGGGYHGFVPLLRGLHTSGETLEEVKKNLKEEEEAVIFGGSGAVKDEAGINEAPPEPLI